MSAWRIYYGDGSTFSNRNSSPFLAPTSNVQVVAYEAATPTGFSLTHGKDNYVWRDEQWHGTDAAGLWDYLYLATGPKAVLFGRTIRDADFWGIVERAGREGLG